MQNRFLDGRPKITGRHQLVLYYSRRDVCDAIIRMLSDVLRSVPNHQVGRVTPLETRGNVGLSGVFGYELDLTTFSEQEEQLVKDQVAFYKEVRRIVQFGDFYRLLNPFEGNEAAWMFVSEDGSEALAFYYKVLAQPNSGFRSLRLKGLNPDALYRLDDGDLFGGDELMNAGLRVPTDLLMGDFRSKAWRLRRAD